MTLGLFCVEKRPEPTLLECVSMVLAIRVPVWAYASVNDGQMHSNVNLYVL